MNNDSANMKDRQTINDRRLPVGVSAQPVLAAQDKYSTVAQEIVI
ncbi:MAG: hypothetical protein NTV45_01820 [Firmicutes bacterium]|jgi:hypothetical protein|nr:hypothetical protein [Bacillota bacterium]